MKGITRASILREMLEMAQHNVFVYSANYGMTEPREGMRGQWEEAIAKEKIIRQMVDELPTHHYDAELNQIMYVRKYVGNIGGYTTRLTPMENPHHYVELVQFDTHNVVDDDAHRDARFLRIDHQLGIDYLLSGVYDMERYKRIDEGKSSAVRVTVNLAGYIKAIEWLDK